MNHLKNVMKQNGITYRQLEKLSGVHHQDCYKIANDYLKPWPSWRKRLASALEVSEAELFPEGGDNQ